MKQFCRYLSTLKSALCVIGPNATKVARTIIPDLEPMKVLANGPKSIKKNLKSRHLDEQALFGMTTESFFQSYNTFKSVRSEHELVIEELRKSASQLDDVGKKTLRERKKRLQTELHKAEENFMIPLLRVPNNLDVNTPIDQGDEILHSNLDMGGEKKWSFNSHQDSKDIEFEQGNAYNVFLKGHWAKKELELLRNVQIFLQKDEFCDMIAAPDIVRSTVIEGCDPLAFGDPTRFLALAKSSDFGDIKSGLGAHLVGGASLPAMVSFFVKNIKSNELPMNLFCVGRTYRSLPVSGENLVEPSLFMTQQSSCVGLLSLNSDEITSQVSFSDFKLKLQSFYDKLGLKYRLVYTDAKNLSLAESLRLEVQMWSVLSEKYVTVGSLSKYEDYISRRLLLKYNNNNENGLKFYHIVAGTFIDTHKVIGCILENQ